MKKNIVIVFLFSVLLLGAAFSSDILMRVPTADSADNVFFRDVLGNKNDVANGSATSLMSIIKGINEAVGPHADHHEHIWPRADGKGTAGVPFSIVTDSEDEDTGAQSNQDYWGEPITFDPSNTAEWKFNGLYIEADTSGKTFQYHVLTCNPSISSAKNGGVAWDKTGTVLTVTDGTIFQAADFVAIVSDYKTEIVIVQSVATHAVTIARETHAVGINGLRWDHTTNDPGTEVLYRVGRPTDTSHHPMGGLYSASTSKDFLRVTYHAARTIEANGFILLRSLNQTDGTNGAAFNAAIIYED